MPEIKKYLSKNGLEDYNELLPHSATQVQEYVSDWLDEHPEATTTVEDNSIATVKLRDGCVTTPKLADESVTPNKISQDLYQLITGNVLRGSASGDIVSVNDAFAAFPLEVAVDGKSTQNGTPTPSAPIPIVSVDGLALTFAGKNLLNAATPAALTYATYTYENDTLTVTATSESTWCNAKYRISGAEWMRGEKITLSAIPSGTSPLFGIEFYRANNTRISYATENIHAITITVPSDTSYIIVLFYARNTSAGAVGDTATYRNIQLEIGDTPTAYEAYTAGHTVTIPLQNHVLRSLPDGTNDTLELLYLRPSTREGWAWYSRELLQAVGHIANMGALTWTYSSTYAMFYVTPDNAALGVDGNTSLMCKGYSGYQNNTIARLRDNMPDLHLAQRSNYATVYVKNLSYTNAATFAASLSEMSLDYPLANPVTTQLDPIELPVLPAPNCTIYADPTTGIMLSYERDLTIAINAIEQAIADL